MSMYTRVVASLIATLFVSFFLFSTSVEAGSKNELSFNGSVQTDLGSKNAASAVTVPSGKKFASFQAVPVYRTPDGLYTLSPTDGAELVFTGYAPGTTSVICGHVGNGLLQLPIGKRLLLNGNVCFKWGLWSSRGVVAPTGTSRLLEVLKPNANGGYEELGVTTNWAKAQEMVAANPGSFVSNWGFVVPVETKGLWVANVPSATQVDPVTGFRLYGSYFDFTLPGFPRTDYGMGSAGFPSVDNSRQTAYFTQGMVRVNVLKSATNNPLDLQDNTPLLTSLVDEQTGKLVIVEGGTIGGGVWIQDPRNPTVMAPPAANYLRPRDARGANGLFNEEIVRAQLFGEWLALWRGSDQTVDGYTKGQLIVYNIRDWIDRGVRTSTTVQLPDAPANGGNLRLGPPAFDPSNRRFWVNYGLQRAYGSVTFSEDFSTATVGEMKYLPLEDGADQHVPTALYFDSSLNRLYIASHRYGPPSGYLAGELTAYSPDGITRLATVRLPGSAIGLSGYPVSFPTDISIVPQGGKNMIVVASSGTNTIVFVDPAMQIAGSIVTLKGKHIAPAIQ